MGATRRAFIGLVAGSVAGMLVTPIPWQFADDSSIWSQNWSWIPRVPKGELTKKAAISKLGPATPVQVTCVGGTPVTVVGGDAKNPLSQGVNALAASEIQMLYSPSRIKGPMKKVGEGKFEAIAWDVAEKLLLDKLTAAKGKAGAVAAISGDECGSVNEVLSALVKGLGSSAFRLMPVEAHAASRAWTLMGGKGLPGFDVQGADVVLAIGADIFESVGPVMMHAKAFNAAKPVGGESKKTFFYAGPSHNRTGAVADEFYGILPGSEAAFAFSLAAELIKAGAAGGEGFEAFKGLVETSFTPAKAQPLTGLAPEKVAELAKKLKAAKAPLVIPGSLCGQGGSPVAYAAGMLLNVLLGNLGKAGGVKAVADMQPVVPGAMTQTEMLASDAVEYLMQVEAGKQPAPEVLLVYEADPAYALPEAENMAKVLGKAGFKVSFSPFMDETAMLCDLILPNAMSLERTEDMTTPYGAPMACYASTPAVIKPVVDAKPAANVLLGLAEKLGLNLGMATFEEVVKARVAALGADAAALKKGGLWTGEGGSASLAMPVQALQKAAAAPADANFPLALAPVALVNVGSSKVAAPPLNIVTIPVSVLQGTDLVVSMNSETAAKAGVKEGQKIKVTAARGEIAALVTIDEGIVTGAVAAPLGLGHTAWDVFSKGKGANVAKLLTVSADPATGMPVWYGAKVKIA